MEAQQPSFSARALNTGLEMRKQGGQPFLGHSAERGRPGKAGRQDRCFQSGGRKTNNIHSVNVQPSLEPPLTRSKGLCWREGSPRISCSSQQGKKDRKTPDGWIQVGTPRYPRLNLHRKRLLNIPKPHSTKVEALDCARLQKITRVEMELLC